MVSFYVYDISFLIVFSLFVTWFLYVNRKSLGREGWIFMYRTQLGVKAMDWFDRKFHRVLGGLRYVIVGLGFVLMAAMIWLLGQSVWIYISRPEIVEVVKAPPIAPLIPYFPELFGLQSVFPPFYFVYFLVALAIVAVVHEFSHGVFMRYSKTKIKSTGLVFLGPILGAFVEEDRTSFHSKDRLNQMSVLGAGVFANMLFALIFYLLYIGFFYLSFTSGGLVFNSYGMAAINSSLIDGVYEEGNYTVLIVGEKNFFVDEGLLFQLEEERDFVVAYEDSPAFNAKLYGVIVGIDEFEVRDQKDLGDVLARFAPGDSVTVYTETEGKRLPFDLTLAEHPVYENRAYLGVGYYGKEFSGIQKILAGLVSFRTGSTFYKPVWDEGVVYFIYHFIWWVMIINLLVALFNMLPLGILDGGRFFYLAVEKFAGEKIAKRAFSWATKLILFVFVLLMAIWAYRIL
jgi:membrane-associated protease RseP (regulator of RpoE activity)